MEKTPTSRLRGLLSPPMLVALLALVVATGGTSYAVAKITSADIKNHTIKVVDLAPATVKKLRGKTGPQGAPGAAGADFTEGIPSGRTITGSVYYRIAANEAGQHLEQSVPFPALAPAALVGADFAVDGSAVTTDDNAACTGTYAQPSAPAGRLCAYLGVPNLFAITNLDTAQVTSLAPGENRGFVVRLVADTVGAAGIDFSWAYTAP